ncbi:hypothetical protein ACGFY7_49105 [Streptomyces prunicolor]|uniref:hypothetical protein n=1 Tax=Streptomyces prunicolor TaxID=67348 RepID=UPI0037197521
MPAPPRAWTVTVSSTTGQPLLACSACPSPIPVLGALPTLQVRRHLAGHPTQPLLPAYLRTCRCREVSCAWHRRQGPCSGPLQLLLIRAAEGRTWHLADTCASCASAIPHAATVPEPPPPAAARPVPGPPAAASTPEPLGEHHEWVEAL